MPLQNGVHLSALFVPSSLFPGSPAAELPPPPIPVRGKMCARPFPLRNRRRLSRARPPPLELSARWLPTPTPSMADARRRLTHARPPFPPPRPLSCALRAEHAHHCSSSRTGPHSPTARVTRPVATPPSPRRHTGPPIFSSSSSNPRRNPSNCVPIRLRWHRQRRNR
jgi:hypothetical protein